MPTKLTDAQAVRSKLEFDPVRNSQFISRLYFSPGWVGEAYVDDPDDVGGLMLLFREKPGGVPSVSIRVWRMSALPELLKALEPGREYRVWGVKTRVAEYVKRRFDVEDEGPTWFLRLPRGADWPTDAPPNIESMRPEDAPHIARHWHPDKDRTEYVLKRIQEGPFIGIREGGVPVAWAGTHHMTDKAANMGFLHVLESHRRKGYAEAVTTRLVQLVLERGLVPTLHIFKDNNASFSLARKVGFKVIDEHNWLDGKYRGMRGGHAPGRGAAAR